VGTATFAAASFIFSGLMFGPDLDLKSKQYYRWGPLRWIWKPYQKLVPHHRHDLSHGLMTGLFFRMAYFTCILSLLWVGSLFALSYAGMGEVVKGAQESSASLFTWLGGQPTHFFLAILFGLWGGAALHTLADQAVSGYKQLSKGKRKASRSARR